MDDIDPKTLIGLFFFIAVLLIPVIVELAAAKRTIVGSILWTGFGVDGGWEIKLVFVALAAIVFLSIPTWGIMRAIFRSSVR